MSNCFNKDIITVTITTATAITSRDAQYPTVFLLTLTTHWINKNGLQRSDSETQINQNAKCAMAWGARMMTKHMGGERDDSMGSQARL